MIMFWGEQKTEIHGSSVSLRQEQFESMQKILKSDIIWGRGKGYVAREGNKHKEMYGYESIVYTEIFDNGIIGFVLFLIVYAFLYIKLLQYSKTKYNKFRVHSLCFPFLVSGFMTGFQTYMFTVFSVFYIMTVNTIMHEQKIIKNDTKNNPLLLALR